MRLFFAIPLDQPTIAALARVQDGMKRQFRRSKVTWVSPKNFHLTLHFLGEIETADNLIARVNEQRFPHPFEIRFKHVGAFPSKKDPQTLHVHAQPQPLLFDVYKRLGDVLANLGLPVDERPFRPHVTLGRVRSRAEVLKPELIDVACSFVADRVVLFQSELTSQGSIYIMLSSFLFEPK